MGKSIRRMVQRVMIGAATGGLSEVAGAAAKQLTPKPPAPQELPAESAEEQAKKMPVSDTEDPMELARRRARTLMTGGLGVVGRAPVIYKSLLGR